MASLRLGPVSRLHQLALLLSLTYIGHAEATMCDKNSQLCSLEVVVEQGDGTLPTQFQKLLAMAPNIKQVHLRVFPPGPNETYTTQSPNVQATAKRLLAIQNSIGQLGLTPQYGFHPDNDQNEQGIQGNWGCQSSNSNDPSNWECVFAHSIQYMNAVNSAITAQHGVPFTIFSIEQSYLEPTNDRLAQQKGCLRGIPSNACQLDDGTQVQASPPVAYGNVFASCGETDLYDAANGFDYGYPQMYNIYREGWTNNDPLIPTDLFPVTSSSTTQTYTLMDAVEGDKVYLFPNIVPTALSKNKDGGTIDSIYEGAIVPGTSSGVQDPSQVPPNPKVAGAIFSDIIQAKYGPAASAPTTGAYPCLIPQKNGTAWLTLSGEQTFLGSAGWNQGNLYSLFSQIYGTITPQKSPAMQTAIWSIDTMIGNVAALTAQQVNYQQSAAFNTHAQKLVLKTSGGVIKGHAGAIHCTGTCTLKVSGGSKLHLEAEPRKGYEFKGWQGACKGNAPHCSVWVDRKKEVKAVFGARGYHH